MLQFFIVLPALLFSAQAAGIMFSLGPEVTQAGAAARRAFRLLDEEPTIISSHDRRPTSNEMNGHSVPTLPASLLKGIDGISPDPHISLRNVTLTYPTRPGRPALNNVSLSIHCGQFVAFVGQSGGGKSSVISLIERFYDPTEGSISINGKDIRKVAVDYHRSRIALVPQDAELFPGSIAFNVSIGGRPGRQYTHKEITEACQKCGLHEFVMSLPEGYNTQCGQKGSTLSGGQRQRVAIARALIRDPEILLLDEPTSQLDSHSELEVRKAIAEASKGRTVIMVAHRLASIQKADSICVFENGRIIETGSHTELCTNGGVYASMVKMQHLG